MLRHSKARAYFVAIKRLNSALDVISDADGTFFHQKLDQTHRHFGSHTHYVEAHDGQRRGGRTEASHTPSGLSKVQPA
jgi:hypothetical protein